MPMLPTPRIWVNLWLPNPCYSSWGGFTVDEQRNGTVIRVTALVFTGDVEPCLQRLQWIPGLSVWQSYFIPVTSQWAQITSLAIVYSTVYSGADQRKHLSSASLVFVRGIHRWPVNSPHKGPVTQKMFPFDDVKWDSNVLTGIIFKTPMSKSRTG